MPLPLRVRLPRARAQARRLYFGCHVTYSPARTPHIYHTPHRLVGIRAALARRLNAAEQNLAEARANNEAIFSEKLPCILNLPRVLTFENFFPGPHAVNSG